MIPVPSPLQVIGVTGGIGSGKSTFAKILAAFGGRHVDGDQLSRQAVLPGSKVLLQIVQVFGEHVLAPDGSLDRKELATIIFENTENKARLEAILHPVILKLFKIHVTEGPWPIIYEATLLFEAKHHLFADLTITLSAQPETVIERVRKRDKLKKEAILSRLASQSSNAFRESLSDIVITNDHDLELLYNKATTLWRDIQQGSCLERY